MYNAICKIHCTKKATKNQALTERISEKAAKPYCDCWHFHNNLFAAKSQCFLQNTRRGVMEIYELFRGKIAEQKKLRRLTNGDIAKMTGYSVSTINAFMAGNRENDKIANAIAKVLDIER
jgi:hypothetical protein